MLRQGHPLEIYSASVWNEPRVYNREKTCVGVLGLSLGTMPMQYVIALHSSLDIYLLFSRQVCCIR